MFMNGSPSIRTSRPEQLGYLLKLSTESDDFFSGMGCLTRNKPFDFGGGDPDHDPDPGIFDVILLY